MSLTRLMLSVRNTLRDSMDAPFIPTFKPSDIQIRPDGQPPATCGEWFIAIYGSGLNQRTPQDDMHIGIGEEYEVTCAVTHRVSKVPFDRLGEEAYVKLSVGMEDLCHKIVGFITGEGRYTVVTEGANALIQASVDTIPVGGIDYIIEPLIWIQTTPAPLQMDESWFVPIQDQAQKYRTIPDANDVIAGLVMNITFGRAFRPQSTARWT